MNRMINVHMLAFEKEYRTRQVMIEITPNQTEEDILNSVFHNGQNEINPQKCCSVSVGDVIQLDADYHLILGMGFSKISEKQFELYKIVNKNTRKALTTWAAL